MIYDALGRWPGNHYCKFLFHDPWALMRLGPDRLLWAILKVTLGAFKGGGLGLPRAWAWALAFLTAWTWVRSFEGPGPVLWVL